MKLPRRLFVATLALGITPVYANDHFARVNEVMLSFGGDATKQFIEIEDTANEAFSGGGYTLFVYGADGTTQEHSQALALSAGTMRITMATSSAFTQFGLATNTTPPNVVLNLGSTLPQAGTACFRKSGTDLHCLSWGAATNPTQTPVNGEVGGAAPPDNMSLQRQPTCAGIGAPTPNATNATGLTCSVVPMTDGGVPTDGAGNPDGGIPKPPGDEGCSASTGDGWMGFAATASLFGLARISRRNRRRVS